MVSEHDAELLKEFAENMDAAVFWVTQIEPKHKVMYVSKAYEKIWGRSCEDLYENATDWVNAIHPEEREHIDDKFFKGIAKGEYEATFRIIQPDGSIRFIHDRGFPVKNEEGDTVRIAGIAVDITEYIHQNKELTQAKKEIADLATKLHIATLENAELKSALAEMKKHVNTA